MDLFRRPEKMDPSEIEALAGLRPLFDPVFRHLIERAVSGHVDVYFAAIPRALIQPFDPDYNPARHAVGAAAISEVHAKWRIGEFCPVWVYQKDNGFIMSDDYIVWEALKEGQPDFIPCWVLGKPDPSTVTDLQGPLDESVVARALGFATKLATGPALSTDTTTDTARVAEDFATLRKQWESGNTAITIDRGLARQFYTDSTLSQIEARIGERPVVAWLLVLGAVLLAPTALLASCILAVILLKWFSLISIPITIAAYAAYQSASSSARSRLGFISWMLAISIVALVVAEPSNRLGQAMISAFLLSLWALRFIYVTAPYFLRTLILRNERAYDLVRNRVSVRSI